MEEKENHTTTTDIWPISIQRFLLPTFPMQRQLEPSNMFLIVCALFFCPYNI